MISFFVTHKIEWKFKWAAVYPFNSRLLTSYNVQWEAERWGWLDRRNAPGELLSVPSLSLSTIFSNILLLERIIPIVVNFVFVMAEAFTLSASLIMLHTIDVTRLKASPTLTWCIPTSNYLYTYNFTSRERFFEGTLAALDVMGKKKLVTITEKSRSQQEAVHCVHGKTCTVLIEEGTWHWLDMSACVWCPDCPSEYKQRAALAMLWVFGFMTFDIFSGFSSI